MIESVTYKFAKALKKDFGEIPEVSSRNYVSNSYHFIIRFNQRQVIVKPGERTVCVRCA